MFISTGMGAFSGLGLSYTYKPGEYGDARGGYCLPGNDECVRYNTRVFGANGIQAEHIETRIPNIRANQLEGRRTNVLDKAGNILFFIEPEDDALSVLKANGLDVGRDINYEYSKIFNDLINQIMATAGSGQYDPATVKQEAYRRLVAQGGWTDDQLAPYVPPDIPASSIQTTIPSEVPAGPGVGPHWAKDFLPPGGPQYMLNAGTPGAVPGIPKPNQSVPPTTPLTPMATGFQNTGAILAAAVPRQPYQSPDASIQKPIKDSSGQTIAIIAGAGILLWMFMGEKK